LAEKSEWVYNVHFTRFPPLGVASVFGARFIVTVIGKTTFSTTPGKNNIGFLGAEMDYSSALMD
jgi:hypothetical protein